MERLFQALGREFRANVTLPPPQPGLNIFFQLLRRGAHFFCFSFGFALWWRSFRLWRRWDPCIFSRLLCLCGICFLIYIYIYIYLYIYMFDIFLGDFFEGLEVNVLEPLDQAIKSFVEL